MSNVIDLPQDKFRDFPREDELFQRLVALVHEYDGEVSLASAIGVVVLLQDHLIEEARG